MTKTDNSHLEVKLDLRRHYLKTYHDRKPTRVLDCCQGPGVIWSHLRREFMVAQYVGLDVKPKPGRLKMDSARYLARGGWDHDVIDIDTYGNPWRHWMSLLPNAPRHPLTVFLTAGSTNIGTDDYFLLTQFLGPALYKRVPTMLRHMVMASKISLDYALTRSYDFGLMVSDVRMATTPRGTRYIGLRLSPSTKK